MSLFPQTMAFLVVIFICTLHNSFTNAQITYVEPQTITVYQFSEGSWLENLVIRPNGNVLVTRLDVPELWEISPMSINHPPSPTLLHRFDSATGLTGIAALPGIGNEDRYVVNSGNYSAATMSAIPETQKLWLVDLSPLHSVNVRKIVDMSKAGFVNGIIPLNETDILIADSSVGCIWDLNVANGEYTQVIRHNESMGPLPTGLQVGVNGLKLFVNGTDKTTSLVYTNTIKQTLWKMAIDVNDVAKHGKPEMIVGELLGDDLVIDPSGTTFIAGGPTNVVVELNINAPQKRTLLSQSSSPVLAGITALAKAGVGLYGTTNGGTLSPVNETVEGGKLLLIELVDITGVDPALPSHICHM